MARAWFFLVVELIFFFSHTPINFLFDLGKFKLSTQHFVFFHLQGSLCFFQGSLQLLLFCF